MGDYTVHAHRAQELIAGLKVDEQLNRRVRGLLNEHIIAIAQVEAILALAAAMNAGNEAADKT
ncbi:hypothetical protein [Streptomyces sp. NPDC001068]|uniref:hypothetical protein n=1 Tax=Streptomyces sp. NPDC001068 TaxID=3364544 RepID=UPI003677130B